MTNIVTLLADGMTIAQRITCLPNNVTEQPIPVGGSYVVLPDGQPFPPQGYIYDQDTKTFIQSLALAKIARNTLLSALCARAIMSGFYSDAISGSPSWMYPSNDTDQANMTAAAITGGMLYCDTGSVWEMREHTAAQAQTVLSDFGAMRDRNRSHLDTLRTEVNACTTIPQVEAINW